MYIVLFACKSYPFDSHLIIHLKVCLLIFGLDYLFIKQKKQKTVLNNSRLVMVPLKKSNFFKSFLNLSIPVGRY